MFLSLFIILPLILGIGLTLAKDVKPIQVTGLLLSIVLVALNLYVICPSNVEIQNFKTVWFSFNHTSSYFAFSASGLGGVLLLLSNLVYVLLFGYLSSIKTKYDNRFYGLLLVTLAGLNGVFLTQDLLLFYFFWEMVLIPVYFLVGIWGIGKNKIKINTTFFLYTVLGSMLMLGGILFIGFGLKPQSFLKEDVLAVTNDFCNTTALSSLFLIAFAIKIPLFPLHSWQPATYKASPTPVTVVLSALMAKMGLFAVVNWLIGLFPYISDLFLNILYIVAFGLVYASLIALVSKNIKKIVAYSSIAHLALIFIALYSNSIEGVHAAFFQMFSHGLVVTGLWLCIDQMERNYKLDSIDSLKGIATANPLLAIFFFFFCLANIALPLTSSFVGEFLMLTSIFKYNWILCLVGCSGVILSAAYTLRIVGKILFGEKSDDLKNTSLPFGVSLVLGILVASILFLGVYPKVLFELF